MNTARARACSAGVLIAMMGVMSGCSAPDSAPDPALVSIVGDLVSAGRSAELGLTLDESDRILPGTLTTLLSDMAQEMSTSITSLELMLTSDEVDENYRDAVLTSARGALEAVHLAQQGETSAALDQLETHTEQLTELEDAG
jgi:hypothetical protein